MTPVVAAFSGGKDSTAMVLRMWERGEDFVLLFTPAGNEPSELFDHVERIRRIVQKQLVQPDGPDLWETIERNRAIPNWRQRFCTRQIKIEPCIRYLKALENPVLCVGLRADEESREGLYGPYADYRYPLREEGWSINDVLAYLGDRGIKIPERTNCKLCYDQRLGEWWKLWKFRRQDLDRGSMVEHRYGHTFRSPGRDRWPASLTELAEEFKQGRVPRGVDLQEDLFDVPDKYRRCRVCSL